MESAIVIKETGSELTEQGVQGIPAEWAQLPLDVLGLHGIKGDEFWAVTKNFYVITAITISAICYGGDSIV